MDKQERFEKILKILKSDQGSIDILPRNDRTEELLCLYEDEVEEFEDYARPIERLWRQGDTLLGIDCVFATYASAMGDYIMFDDYELNELPTLVEFFEELGGIERFT